MFNSDDFIMPLEKELKLKIINTEVDECSDLDALKENLKSCAKSLLHYQHLLAKICERQLEDEILKAFQDLDINQN
ncbi:MAG: hypothetical protein CL831_00130 [Crocinitomicaceae bacterium]|nr:hypothetical protein [Crocinitomicaceae bacterium]|tara:strand:+ start:783 stop:1010 length:228 start_codon:yes stop_codon:yes gene_type:complete